MKFTLVLAAIAAVASAVPALEQLNAPQWVNFKSTHNKQYSSVEEELSRLEIFNNHLIDIAEHNKLYDAGLSTYQLGVTKFTDLTKEEFMAFVNRNISASPKPALRQEYVPPVNEAPATTVDWVYEGAVSPVKDQGECGSSWVFSAVGAIEGQFYRTETFPMVLSLSEQNVIDCSDSYGNHGCTSGSVNAVYDYIGGNGITTNASYPYVAEKQQCNFYRPWSITSVRGYIQIDRESNLISAIKNIGPISVAIDATELLQNYKYGILIDNRCSTNTTNHAALLVGLTEDAYVIKNSWGTEWGEKGYFRYSRSVRNPCGIASSATYPIV